MAGADLADAIPPRPRWQADALCRERPGTEFVFDGSRTAAGREAVATAVAVCSACLVKRECGAYALADPTLLGIWGGTTEAERRKVRAGVAATSANLDPRQGWLRYSR